MLTETSSGVILRSLYYFFNNFTKDETMTTETKQDRFKRVGEKRVNSILKMIKLLGNLSARNNYAYSKEDIIKIFETVENEVTDCRRKFENESVKEKFEL